MRAVLVLALVIAVALHTGSAFANGCQDAKGQYDYFATQAYNQLCTPSSSSTNIGQSAICRLDYTGRKGFSGGAPVLPRGGEMGGRGGRGRRGEGKASNDMRVRGKDEKFQRKRGTPSRPPQGSSHPPTSPAQGSSGTAPTRFETADGSVGYNYAPGSFRLAHVGGSFTDVRTTGFVHRTPLGTLIVASSEGHVRIVHPTGLTIIFQHEQPPHVVFSHGPVGEDMRFQHGTTGWSVSHNLPANSPTSVRTDGIPNSGNVILTHPNAELSFYHSQEPYIMYKELPRGLNVKFWHDSEGWNINPPQPPFDHPL